jgi:hypothetical protein
MAIYLLDADLGGTDSIETEIEAGVEYIPIGSFPEYEDAVRKLLPKVGPDDLVILDTISSLANTVRGDAKLGTDTTVDLWEKRSKYTADPQYLTVYELAAQLIMRRLKNLRSRGARIITTCHEDEHRDEISMTKKRAPGLNEAFYKALMAATSDVFPLSVQLEDKYNNAGEIAMKAGTRILNLRMSEDYVTKHHVPRARSEALPKGIKDPTLPKLYEVLGKRPSWLCIYGPPGVGKSALAVSELTPPTPAKKARTK